MKRGGVVYIMSNKTNTTLYIGMTSDLRKRVDEHKNKIHLDSFTAKYNMNKLVYFEIFGSIEEAISREKYLKGKKRDFKDELITKKFHKTTTVILRNRRI